VRTAARAEPCARAATPQYATTNARAAQARGGPARPAPRTRPTSAPSWVIAGWLTGLAAALVGRVRGAAGQEEVVRFLESAAVFVLPSEIRHDGRTVFHGLPQPFTATRYHSLIVERASLPRELEISAECDDTEPNNTAVAATFRSPHRPSRSVRLKPDATHATIMGLRWRKKGAAPVEGVQFHPESVLTDAGIQLLRNFLEL